MADFPSLIPAPRYQLSPGSWAMNLHVGMNAGETRIRHADVEMGRRLQLDFPAITRAQMLEIVDHYRAQSSGFLPFAFNAATLPAGLTPTGYSWLYAGPPNVTDRHADCFNVSCEFVAEPRGLRSISSRAWITPATTLADGAFADDRWGQKAWVTTKRPFNAGALVIGELFTSPFRTEKTTLTPGSLT